jgi:PAS domain S-box-containing protein
MGKTPTQHEHDQDRKHAQHDLTSGTDAGEAVLANRETWVCARERAADARQSEADSREMELVRREELARLRENALRARAETDEIRADREELLRQTRDANEKLVIATLRADELAEAAIAARETLAGTIDALRESVTRYRALFESIDEGFCVLEILFDHEGTPVDLRCMEANPAFEKQSGLHDVVGKRIRELIPDLEGRWAQTYGNVVATGKPARFVDEAKPLGRWFDVSAFRIGEAKDLRVACLFTDVTASRRAQQEMTHLAAIVRSSFDAILTEDLRGTILSWNGGAQRLFGYTFQEAVGQPGAMLLPAGCRDEDSAILDRIMRGETVDQYESVRQRKDGEFVHVALTISPLRDADGGVIGAAKVARDITERKRAEAQIQAASRAKDEFIAMLGHELRNPLAPILTALDLMSMRDPNASDRERTIIRRQIGHLVRLVDDLLDVSRITSGKIDLHREPIEIADIVQRAVEMASPLLEKKFHDLVVDVPNPGLAVDGDATRLAQVVANLLTNAAKYTQARGRIVVTGERRRGIVSLRVRDTGIGISQEMLPHVFELFAQERQTIDRSMGGLGLGLALVRSLVALHGGTVSAHSEGLGRGSEFAIELPALTEEVEIQPRTRALRGSLPLTSRPPGVDTILVVDDNRDAAEMLADSLIACGYQVRVAFDGPSAIEIARDFMPDVALLDIGLPVMDGYELASRLRALLAHRDTRFIAITGYGQGLDRSRSRDAGFVLHLVKPVDISDILDALRQVAEGSGSPG